MKPTRWSRAIVQAPAEKKQEVWTSKEFEAAAKVSHTFLWSLPDELKPHSVKVGRARRYIESPRDWLKRVGKV